MERISITLEFCFWSNFGHFSISVIFEFQFWSNFGYFSISVLAEFRSKCEKMWLTFYRIFLGCVLFLNDSKAQNWLIFTVEVGATNGRLSLLSRRSTRVPTSTKGLFERFFGTKTTFSAVSSLLCTLFHSPASDKRWRRDSTFPLSYVLLCGTTQCLKITLKVVETKLKQIPEKCWITENYWDLLNYWELLRYSKNCWE